MPSGIGNQHPFGLLPFAFNAADVAGTHRHLDIVHRELCNVEPSALNHNFVDHWRIVLGNPEALLDLGIGKRHVHRDVAEGPRFLWIDHQHHEKPQTDGTDDGKNQNEPIVIKKPADLNVPQMKLLAYLLFLGGRGAFFCFSLLICFSPSRRMACPWSHRRFSHPKAPRPVPP